MSLELLLTQVSSINKKYEEIARISGENFNIFNILDLTTKELIHSKVLAMLLNPKGEHNMGYNFLKLFVETIAETKNIEKFKNIDFTNVKVNIEKTIDNGRIDILVTTKLITMIIENKIYANDKNEQLLRYYEYDNNAVLFYLTLYGTLPDDTSIKRKNERKLENDKDYYCISYKEHILNWLDKCRKEAVNSPFLRETINQYILLIKQLTGQARSKKMIEEYKDIIVRNPENIEAAYSLYRSFIDIRKLIFKNDIIPAFENIAKEHGYTFNKSTKYKFLEKYWCCYLQKENWGNKKIGFTFEDDTLSGIIYWIHRENIDPDFEKYVLANYGENKGYRDSDDYVMYKYTDKYKDWYLAFVKEWYTDNTEIIKYFKGIVKELTEIVESKEYK